MARAVVVVASTHIHGPHLDSYPGVAAISPRRAGAHHPRGRGGVGAPSHTIGDAGRRCPARAAAPPHQVWGHPAPTQALVVPLARPRHCTRSRGIQRRIPHQTLTQGRRERRGEMDEDWGTEGWVAERVGCVGWKKSCLHRRTGAWARGNAACVRQDKNTAGRKQVFTFIDLDYFFFPSLSIFFITDLFWIWILETTEI
jgi:hypothetical protein